MQLLGRICGYGIFYAAFVVAVASFLLPANHPLGKLVVDNKMQVFLGGYVLTMVGGQFLSTGAFEVYVNGTPYFIKEGNGFPDLDALARNTAAFIAGL